MTADLSCIIWGLVSFCLFRAMGEGVRCSEPSGLGHPFAQKLRPAPFYPHLFSLGIFLVVFLCLNMLTWIFSVELHSPFFSDFSFAFFPRIILNSICILQYTGNHSQLDTCKINNLTVFSSASLLRKASSSPVLRICPCGILWRVCQRRFQNQFP